MKKILSMVMASVMALSTVTANVSAEEYTTKTFYSKIVKLLANRSGFSFMERYPEEINIHVSDAEKASGEYSLFVDASGKYNGKNLDSGDVEQYFGNTADSNFSMPSNMKAQTEYTFSAKVKIAEGGSIGQLRVYQTGQQQKVSTDKVPPYYFFNQMDITEGEDGWKTYTKTFNTLSNAGSYLHFTLGGAQNVYIDDLYLKDNTNNQLLIDYGFEDVVITDMYAPTNIEVLTEDYGEMEIAWYNPLNYNATWDASGLKVTAKENGILNISLYDVSDSENPEEADIDEIEPIFSVDKDETIDTYPGVTTIPNERSVCLLSGLESDTEYKFILAVTTDKTNTDGTVTEVLSKELITGTTLKIPEGWKPPVETLPNFHHIMPTGFMNDATETNDPSINIAFYNPKSSDIKEITLDRVIDGECVRVDGTSFSLANNAINSHEINGLVKGQSYQFKLTATFNDGTKQSAVFDGVAGVTERPSKVNGWVPYWSAGANENTPAVVRMDTTEKHSGESSVYLSTALEKSASNRYVMYQCNGISFRADSSYKVSFWAKAKNYSYIRFYAGWPNASRLVQYSGITDEWEYHEITMNNLTAAGSQLLIITDSYCEDLWIDDISVKMVGEDKELMTNGNCEVDSNTELEALLNVTYEAQDKKVKLSWTNALKALTKYVNIYDVENDKQSFKGSYSGDEAVVFDLINDKTHTLVLKAVDANGREGKEVRIDVVPVAPDYALTDANFYNADGEKLSEVTAGEITASVYVKNKCMGDDFGVTLVAALYDGYEMIASEVSENIVPENPDNEEGELVSVKITVPDDAEDKDYQLKFFMWDNHKDKNILRSHKQL